MIWIVFIAITAVALFILLMGRKAQGSIVDPIDHFRAQLAEIDADVQAGMIENSAAEVARIEIQRRILRAGNMPQSTVTTMNDRLPIKVTALYALVVIGAVFGVYMLLGSPGVSSAARSARAEAEDQLIEKGGPTFAEAIEQVQAHLALNPRDVRGWEVLGKSAGAVGNYALAADAYGELARLDPQEPDWRVQEFEAFMAHASGQITPAARLVLAALMDINPDHPAGQFYVGLAQVQAGNKAGAKSTWLALADRSAADAPWMPLVRRQLASLGVSPPQLSTEDMGVVNAMTPEEREGFILSMMERLRNRLESAPNDPEGWLMFARSQLAMGDKEAAISTLRRGILAVSDQNAPELQAFLDNLLTNSDP